MPGRQISRGVFATSLLIALGSNCLPAQPFLFRKDILLAENPVSVVPADLNGDGRPDLVVALLEGYVTLLNKGGGNFGQPVRHSGGLYGTVVADFNGDGNDDLVAGISSALLLSRGDGTFLPPRIVSSGEPLAAGDFNRDGASDLLVTLSGSGTGVLLGNGDGTFQPGATITTEKVLHAKIADFNGDGLVDLAIQASSGMPEQSVLVFLGRGDGTFSPGLRTSFVSWQIQEMKLTPFLIADITGDGLLDIATGNQILFGQGDGGFRPGPPYPSEIGELFTFPIAAADFDSDGHAELVTRNLVHPNLISIFPGSPDGMLQLPSEHAVGWLGSPPFLDPFWAQLSPSHTVWSPVDVDGDGRLDLVTTNYSSNSVSILMPRDQEGPELRRAVSAADYAAVVAPGSLATLFVPTMATSSTSASPPWPTDLGGIGLEVRDSTGVRRLAPLIFVSPTQINFQVPAATALGEAMLAIVSNGEATEVGSMEVDTVAPRLFMLSHAAETPAATGVLIEADGTQVPVPIFKCVHSDESPCSVWQDAPIPVSSAAGRPIYLSFFGTGFRGANQDNVTCSIGSDVLPVKSLPVVYAGPQETPGVDQINIQLLPEVFETPVGPYAGGAQVVIRLNGSPANTAWIHIR